MPPIVLGAIGTDILNLARPRLSKSDFGYLSIVVGTWRANRSPGAKHDAAAIEMLRQHQDVLSYGMQQLVEHLGERRCSSTA